MIAVEKIDDTARFATIRDDWNELLRNSDSDSLFLTWEWLFTWWKHLAEDRRLHILTVRNNDGELMAIAPFALRAPHWKRLLPFQALEFLGTGGIGSDYLDIIVRRGMERHAIAALAAHLAERQPVLELGQVNRGAAHAIALALELKQRGWGSTRTPTDLCPFISFSGLTWESYLASLGREHRYNFRRRLKNLSKQWDVRFEQVQSEAERGEALRALIALHSLRWHERGSRGAFCAPELVAFHEELSQAALRQGWLRLHVLRLDGEAAAVLYGFRYNDVLNYYQSGFDPALRRHSVGLVTMGLAIKSALEEGTRSYDFLRGDESYKMLWTHEERELVRLELYPPCARGALYKQAMELRGGIKRMVLHYPGAA